MTLDHDDAFADALDHDDAFLDALGTGDPVPDDELADAFLAWRDDIDEPALPPLPAVPGLALPGLPLPAGGGSAPLRPVAPIPRQIRAQAGRGGRPGSVTPGDRRGSSSAGGRPGAASAGGGPGGSPAKRRWRIPRALVVAGAATLLAFGGLTVASATAQPGNPLWPITRIFFSDTAKNREAEQQARDLLDQTQAAISAKDPVKAADLLTRAQAQIGQLADPQAKAELTERVRALLDQLRALGVAITPLPTGGPGAGGTATPTPGPSGLLPPILPSGLLPSLPLPSLPLPKL